MALAFELPGTFSARHAGGGAAGGTVAAPLRSAPGVPVLRIESERADAALAMRSLRPLPVLQGGDIGIEIGGGAPDAAQLGRMTRHPVAVEIETGAVEMMGAALHVELLKSTNAGIGAVESAAFIKFLSIRRVGGGGGAPPGSAALRSDELIVLRPGGRPGRIALPASLPANSKFEVVFSLQFPYCRAYRVTARASYVGASRRASKPPRRRASPLHPLTARFVSAPRRRASPLHPLTARFVSAPAAPCSRPHTFASSLPSRAPARSTNAPSHRYRTPPMAALAAQNLSWLAASVSEGDAVSTLPLPALWTGSVSTVVALRAPFDVHFSVSSDEPHAFASVPLLSPSVVAASIALKQKKGDEQNKSSTAASARAVELVSVELVVRRDANVAVVSAAGATVGGAAAGGDEEAKDDAGGAGECSCIYRYISRESCSQFDLLPLTSLPISTFVAGAAAAFAPKVLRPLECHSCLFRLQPTAMAPSTASGSSPFGHLVLKFRQLQLEDAALASMGGVPRDDGIGIRGALFISFVCCILFVCSSILLFALFFWLRGAAPGLAGVCGVGIDAELRAFDATLIEQVRPQLLPFAFDRSRVCSPPSSTISRLTISLPRRRSRAAAPAPPPGTTASPSSSHSTRFFLRLSWRKHR